MPLSFFCVLFLALFHVTEMNVYRICSRCHDISHAFVSRFETKAFHICMYHKDIQDKVWLLHKRGIFFFWSCFFKLYFHVVLFLNTTQPTESDYGIVHCFKHCDVDSQLEDLKRQCLPWGLISRRSLSSIHHSVQLTVWRQCGTSCHHVMWPEKEQHDKTPVASIS